MKVSIVGVTGYSGLELIRLLAHHHEVEIGSIHATKEVGQPLSHIYPHLKGICDLTIEAFDADKIMECSDLVFFATPSGIAKEMAAEFVAKDFPVIDISGDHRLPATTYEKWYKKAAADQAVLDKFVYSIAEFNDLTGVKFVSNPGCYATATELALVPVIKAGVVDVDTIVVDAKSGLTGAGKGLADASHFVNVHDNYVTYKLNQHQHIPEIIQELKKYDASVNYIQFSTSLLPVNRGIMATAYMKLKNPLTQEELMAIFNEAYGDKPFVRVHETLPNLHTVLDSNYTDIGFAYNEVTNTLTVVSVIDNLIKGAAGQAIQNMNKMFGFDETAGLTSGPAYL